VCTVHSSHTKLTTVFLTVMPFNVSLVY